jgi:type II secretory pathway pseudopilin PulG
MSTTAIVLIVVGVLVVLAIITFVATRGRRLEERRQEAQEVRGEAQAKARRAEQARLSAEEQAERARTEQRTAAELHQKANELDPDVDTDSAPGRADVSEDATAAERDGRISATDRL